MDILIFDIKGRFAHFRKFYTNSSSLSYSIPPRTALQGLVAAILGIERDEYYEEFSGDNFEAAVKKLNNTRRIMQTVNYMKATSANEIINPKEHTQIPFEIITGEEGVKFRVYVYIKDDKLMKELIKRIKNKEYAYIPYLGVAPFNCSLEFVGLAEGLEAKNEDYVILSTPIPSEVIIKGGLDLRYTNYMLVRETMPAEFLKDRVIGKTVSYIFDERGMPIRSKISSSYVKIRYKETSENILFL